MTTVIRYEQLVALARKGDASIAARHGSHIGDHQVEPSAHDLLYKVRALVPAIRESMRRPILKGFQIDSVSLVDKPAHPSQRIHHVHRVAQDDGED